MARSSREGQSPSGFIDRIVSIDIGLGTVGVDVFDALALRRSLSADGFVIAAVVLGFEPLAFGGLILVVRRAHAILFGVARLVALRLSRVTGVCHGGPSARCTRKQRAMLKPRLTAHG